MTNYNKGLSEVAVTQFDTDFLVAYQATVPKLDNLFDSIHGLMGDSYVWKQIDQVKMHTRGAYHSATKQTIPAYRKITMYPDTTFEILSLPSDIFEQTVVNASESVILAKTATNSLNRAQDQIRINALNRDKANYEEVTATSNLTVAILRKISRIFGDNNIPDDERYFVGTHAQKDSLLAQEKATSSDYATIKALVDGNINTFMGFKFIWIGNMIEGGMAKSGSIRDCYACSRSGLGEGYWLEPSMRIAWQEDIDSHVVKPKLKMGAKVKDTKGVIYVPCTEA